MHNSIEMPRYDCHKTVHALKIKFVEANAAGEWAIIPDDPRYAPFVIPTEYLAKHSPQPGGYYVVYEDGYKSFSPAEAFESGYTRIQEPIGNQPFPGEDAITDAINEATMNRNSL